LAGKPEGFSSFASNSSYNNIAFFGFWGVIPGAKQNMVLPSLLSFFLLFYSISAQSPAGEAFLVVGVPAPPTLDLRNADSLALIQKNALDEAEAETVRTAWQIVIQPYLDEDAIQVRLPNDIGRVALMLAASQALKAHNPFIKIYLSYDENAPSNWDESFWGALDGGALDPGDLQGLPRNWLSILSKAQEQLPARQWTIWCPRDPGADLPLLVGNGARLVVPSGSPAATLADSLPEWLSEISGKRGQFSVKDQSGQRALHWQFADSAWQPAVPGNDPNIVVIEGTAEYDVYALLAKVRATQLRDSSALRTQESQLNISIHIQSVKKSAGSRGVDTASEFGFIFQSFEVAGEPEEFLQEQVLLNGVRANVVGRFQLPIIESKRSLSPPVVLNLTENYGYGDGGSGGPGKRWIRFSPKSGDPNLFSGQILVDETTGRILEERSERTNLPGIVKAERRTLIYGEPTPGYWRVVDVKSFEQWMLSGGIAQVQRDLSYSGFKINHEDFFQSRDAARASNRAMLRQTEGGMRYLVRGEGGSRHLQQKQPSFARMVGVGIVADPALDYPVLPVAGFAFLDYDAFGKDIQYFLLPMGVYNMGTISVPNLPYGFDLGIDFVGGFLPSTDRPALDGKLLDKEGVSRQTGQISLSLGRVMPRGFRLRLDGQTIYNRYSEAKDEKYRTPGYIIPPSGFTSSLTAEVAWMYRGFQLRGNYGEGIRPDGFFGLPDDPQPIANGGKFKRWGGAAAYDYRLNHKGWIQGELGMERGTGGDRFWSLTSSRAPGFRSHGIKSDQVQRATLGYVHPASQFFRLSCHIDHSRARSMDNKKTYGFTGLALTADIPGFKWFTLLRADIGIGLHSDIPGIKGVNGTIAALRLF
jgi:hypothetical protein